VSGPRDFNDFPPNQGLNQFPPQWQHHQPPSDFGAAAGRHHFGDEYNAVRFNDLAPRRKVPPTAGWRKAVYHTTFQLVNLGKSKAERHQDQLEDRIKRDIRRQYVIAVVAPSGAGATTLTTAIGETFKICRPKNVLAIDADPGFGTLAIRVAETARGDIAALLKDSNVEVHSDMKPSLTVSRETGLEALAGARIDAPGRWLTPEMFSQVMRLVVRTAVHEVVLVDCGKDLEHPVMRAVLHEADMLVLVSGLTADSAIPVGRAIKWLKNAGYNHLVSRCMVILNDWRGDGHKDSRVKLKERFVHATGSNAVEDMFFDPYLAKGGIIDIKHQLDKGTRLRLHEITARLADFYIPEAGRPAGHAGGER
jgi:MinD-like ATPase involved in chromosome partitioning or flagellar assembly